MTDYSMRTYEPFKFLGRFWFAPLRVAPKVPPVTRTYTHEADGEFRIAPTVVIRLPFNWGVALGWWLDTDIEDPESERVRAAEEAAANAAYDAYVAVNGQVPRETWDAARRKVAEMGLDPDDEMEAMQSLGIFE